MWYSPHVPDRLTTRYTTALELARGESLAAIAQATGRHVRTLEEVRRGTFGATPEAARGLARYLRRRAGLLTRTAEALEQAARGRKEKR
jgi:hypothetical protein